MALILADRVQQTGTANTTVSFTLSGSVAGFQSFTAIGDGNTTFYSATDATGNWESGLGTYATSGPTLTRTTVYASSNSGSAVTFSGTVNIFVTYPSSRSVNLNASGNVSPLGTIASGTWNGSTIPVAYGGTGTTSSSGASSVVLRDANQNVVFNNFIQGTALTTAAAGTTVLTVASARTQILVGSTTQTYQLPDATTLALGQSFIFVNASSGNITVQNAALATIDVIPSGGASQLGAVNIATVAGTWGIYSFLPGSYNFNSGTADFGTATITNATYQGGTIASGYGGTGLTTFAGANNALYSTSSSALAAGTLPAAAGGTSQSTYATGDILYASATNTLSKLTAGTNGYVLTLSSGVPIWAAASGGGGTPGGSSGQLQYNNSSAFGGVTNVTVASGQTTARIDPRVLVGSNSATSVTPDISLYDMYVWNALSTASTLTISAPTGTPLNGDKLMFRIQDDGSTGAVTLSWNAIFRQINVPIPTTTGGAGKVVYVGCIYNSYSTTWDVIASGTQF